MWGQDKKKKKRKINLWLDIIYQAETICSGEKGGEKEEEK